MTIFHKTEPPWFESLKDLKPGGKRRLGDGFLGSFNGRAYQRYDFREKQAEVWMPQMTLAERLSHQRAMREAEDSAVLSSQLPELMYHPRDWPMEARVWLHKASISNVGISALGAGWSASMARVVIPVRMLDGSQQWIARSLSPDVPKYLFPKGMKRGGGTYLGPATTWPETAAVVVTEDYLSAYRVTEDTSMPTVSALGTTLDRDAIVSIAQRFSGVVLWLDPDKYGNIGSRQLLAAFQRLDKPVVAVHSALDPKNHTPAEVWAYVDNAIKRLSTT